MQFRNVIVGQHIYGEDIKLDQIDESFNFSRLTHRYTKSLEPEKNKFDTRGLNYQLSGADPIISNYSHKQ